MRGFPPGHDRLGYSIDKHVFPSSASPGQLFSHTHVYEDTAEYQLCALAWLG